LGRGFVLVRGLRTHLYSDALSAAIYYVLGLHMGDPAEREGRPDRPCLCDVGQDGGRSHRQVREGARQAGLSFGLVGHRRTDVPAPGALGQRLGAAGAIAVCAEGVLRVPGRPVAPVDTVGG
jgi:hypothetical protein